MSVTDGSDTAALIDGSIEELGQSLKELRDLARGIHPAVLSERGLEPAVRALAARAPVPVDIVGHAAGRLPAAVETAAYFVVSEADERFEVRGRRARDRERSSASTDNCWWRSATTASEVPTPATAPGFEGWPTASRRSAARSRSPARPAAARGCEAAAAMPVSALADRALRVVVAEDSFLLRAGVVRVLEATGFVVVGEAADADSSSLRCASTAPTSSSPTSACHQRTSTRASGGCGHSLGAPADRSSRPLAIRQAELRHSPARGEQRRRGYLLKDRVMEPRGFAEAVRRVARGGSALDPEVIAQMLERRRRSGPLDELGERELGVLAGMADGRSTAIATDLGIGEHAVQRDVAAIFRKLELPVGVEGHRRVRAVVTYLRAQEAEGTSAGRQRNVSELWSAMRMDRLPLSDFLRRPQSIQGRR